jgi:hypothetical protein
MMPVGELTTEMSRERQRAAETLGRFCGLQDGQSAWACGREWWGYFDEERRECSLLVWDAPARLGVDASSARRKPATRSPCPGDTCRFHCRR